MLIVYSSVKKNLRRRTQLTNFIVCDLETFNTHRAGPFCVSLYRLSEIASKKDRD